MHDPRRPVCSCCGFWTEFWEVVDQYLGDKLTTVLNHYVRADEDALRDSVAKLEHK